MTTRRLGLCCGLAPVLLALTRTAAAAPTASFDCAKTRAPIEKLICSNDELAALDAALGRAYAPEKLPAEKAAALRREQRQWLDDRLTVCNIPRAEAPPTTAIPCLVRLYRERLRVLAGGSPIIPAVAAALPAFLRSAVSDLKHRFCCRAVCRSAARSMRRAKASTAPTS